MRKIKTVHVITLSVLLLTFSCATTEKKHEQLDLESNTYEQTTREIIEEINPEESSDTESNIQNQYEEEQTEAESLTLLFAGDIMAHEENYRIDDFNKIWIDVKEIISQADLAFGNIESPIDQTKKVSAYPYFNMSKQYAEAAVEAGFDVFSLSNNHTFDKGVNGMQETLRTTKELSEKYSTNENPLYFSGIRENPKGEYTYNIIEKKGWKILFLPVTELLNLQEARDYVNYSKNTEEGRDILIKYCKSLREKNSCDLFILSFHTSEPEYVRSYKKSQTQFYEKLLDAGVDIVWANHAHLIKDRKIIIDTQNHTQKIIMYGNGNTISGQRRAPELTSKNPNGERDNTGDGLLYKVTFTKKSLDSKPEIAFAKPIFITTYINTANHFILRKLDDEFINYLYNVNRTDWAEYIKRRKSINEDYTKDLIEWR